MNVDFDLLKFYRRQNPLVRVLLVAVVTAFVAYASDFLTKVGVKQNNAEDDRSE